MADRTADHTASTAKEKPQSGRGRKRLFQVVSLLVTLALMAYILNHVEWAAMRSMLVNMPVQSLIGAFIAYTVLNIFRAVRFRILLERRESPYRLLIPITFYHNFLVRVLPFKMGELSYIVLLRNRLGYSVEEGVSSLFGARLLELIMILLVAGSALLASGGALTVSETGLIALSLIGFIICMGGLYFSGTLLQWGANMAERILKRLFSQPPHLLLTLISWVRNIALELRTLQHPVLFTKSLLITVFTYGGSFVTFYLLLRGAGLDVSLPVMVAIISLGMFASAFPFSVSGFGVVELSWAAGLIYLAGYSTADASAVGLLLHGFQIIVATVIGVLGYAAIQLQPQ